MAWLMLFLILPTLISGYCTPNLPCQEGFECHPIKYKCFSKAPYIDRPSIFIGCGRNSSECEFFGFDYVGNYGRRPDTDEWCNEGTNVMCASMPAPALPKPTPANEFRFMTYNIWERNLFITMDGQRERTCRFPRHLAEHWPNVDVITFQETFMGGCWPDQASLRDLLAQHGFPYSTKNVDDPSVFLNGGIFIASRWPIIEEDQMIYIDYKWPSWDAFASKGVSYARINKTVNGKTMTYHAMGTHNQAGASAELKHAQSKAWGEFIRSKKIPVTEAVFMGGDFNTRIDSPVLKTILANLGATVPPKTGYYNYTIDIDNNDCVRIKNDDDASEKKILDYSIYSNQHFMPKSATFEIVNPRADKAFPVCWCEVCPWPREYTFPNKAECDRIEYIRSLADHQPVIGTFIFE